MDGGICLFIQCKAIDVGDRGKREGDYDIIAFLFNLVRGWIEGGGAFGCSKAKRDGMPNCYLELYQHRGRR